MVKKSNFLPAGSVSFLLAAGLLPLMLSARSLWIDEGAAVLYSRFPNGLACWHELCSTKVSDAQMPLYLLLVWVWSRLLGTTELAFRLPNLLYGFVALWGMARVGRRCGLPWLPLALAIHPFFFYYMDEARPYALLFALGAWLLAGVVDFLQNPAPAADARWAWTVGLSSVLLVMTHLLGLFPVAAAAGVIGWHLFRQTARLAPCARRVVLVCTPPFALALGWQGWTLLRGVQGGVHWSVGPANLAFAVYEFLGLQAFGPPRELLRAWMRAPQGATRTDWAPYLPGLAVAALLLAAVLVLVIRGRRGVFQEVAPRALAGGFLLGVAVLAGLSFPMKFPIWGRHFAAFFPWFILLAALGLRDALRTPERRAAWLTTTLAAVLLAGSLNLRFNPRYGKEDYRTASTIARSALAEGQTVWWIANELLADYYGLSSAPGSERLYFAGSAAALPPRPDLVLVSRPEVYDVADRSRMIHALRQPACRGFDVFVAL